MEPKTTYSAIWRFWIGSPLARLWRTFQTKSVTSSPRNQIRLPFAGNEVSIDMFCSLRQHVQIWGCPTFFRYEWEEQQLTVLIINPHPPSYYCLKRDTLHLAFSSMMEMVSWRNSGRQTRRNSYLPQRPTRSIQGCKKLEQYVIGKRQLKEENLDCF